MVGSNLFQKTMDRYSRMVLAYVYESAILVLGICADDAVCDVGGYSNALGSLVIAR